MFFDTIDSPIGPLTIAASATHIAAVHMGGIESLQPRMAREDWLRAPERVAAAAAQLRAYFAGELRQFTLPLAPHGTPFQLRVWNALLQIPFGSTASYGDIAARIGAPGAARAIGAANGRNPIAIVVPCHRVIGANGSLTGYAGGMERKQYLLRHEAGLAAAQIPLLV